MTHSEYLLQAIGEVNDDAVRDARFGDAARRHTLRKFVTVALAAALVLSMSITAGAFVGAEDWFKWYFHRRQDLSGSQQQYISDAAVGVGQSVTQNGYTVTLDSVMMDSQQIYVRVLVFAPDGVSLKTAYCQLKSELYMVIDGEEYGFTGAGSTSNMFTDRVGELNELTVVISCAVELPAALDLSNGECITCGLRLTDLCFSSIVEDKDWTVDGQWEFAFTLTDVTQSVELLTEPVTVTMGDVRCAWNIKGSSELHGKTWQVMLHSVQMTPMGMTVRCQILDKDWPGMWYGEYARLIMKDGSTVQANMSGADLGGWNTWTSKEADWLEQWKQTEGNVVCTYYFSVPVDLSEAEYLEFEDGTKIPIN